MANEMTLFGNVAPSALLAELGTEDMFGKIAGNEPLPPIPRRRPRLIPQIAQHQPRIAAMPDLKTQFEQAKEAIMALAERPDNDTLLRLYALYKQGSEGDVSGPPPGMFDFVASAKYQAWQKLEGTSPESAMKKYVALVESLQA